MPFVNLNLHVQPIKPKVPQMATKMEIVQLLVLRV